MNTNVLPMRPRPPGAPPQLVQPVHTHADVPQHVRFRASTIHTLAAKVHATLGRQAATPAALDEAEESLLELAQRALILHQDLVAERKRLAGRA